MSTTELQGCLTNKVNIVWVGNSITEVQGITENSYIYIRNNHELYEILKTDNRFELIIHVGDECNIIGIYCAYPIEITQEFRQLEMTKEERKDLEVKMSEIIDVNNRSIAVLSKMIKTAKSQQP